MSVREFAAHLGVSDRMVSKWEAGGESIRPRPLNQAALDTSLALSTPDVQSRFSHITIGQPERAAHATPSGQPQPLPEAVRHLARHPLDGKLMTLIEGGPHRVGPTQATVWLSAFYIDVYPTTVAEYDRFLLATGRRPPPYRPGGICPASDLEEVLGADATAGETEDEAVTSVTNLSGDDACAYAEWSAKRLPTIEQWDRAARGAEGMVVADLSEWCLGEHGPVRHGPKDRDRGGFRCVLFTEEMLTLLAI